MSSITLFAVLVIALGANAQDIDLIGQCDQTINAMTSFDASAYLGRWYEQYRFATVFEAFAKCVTADYSLNADGTLNVTNTQVNSLTNSMSNIVGTATFVDSATVGKLTVKFPVSPFSGNYWVLATDYANYAVVYSCTNVLASEATFAWILTRAANPAPAVIQAAVTAARGVGLDTSKFNKTNQDANCKYA